MVRLSQIAPWNPNLRADLYRRTRFAAAGGRYFRVVAEWGAAPWIIEEITADGEFIAYPKGSAPRRLSEARTLIEELTT